MAFQNLVAQPISGGTLAAAATTFSAIYAMSPSYQNLYLVLELGATPTGTTPVMAVNLQASLDGNNFSTVGTGIPNQNAQVYVTAAFTNVFYPFFRLQYIVGGTTPSFTAIYVSIYAY